MSDINATVHHGAVTPTKSDTVNDPLGPFTGFYVGSTGNVKVTTVRGQDVVFVAPVVGQFIPIAHLRVWSTGTTAGSLLCFQAMAWKSASS